MHMSFIPPRRQVSFYFAKSISNSTLLEVNKVMNEDELLLSMGFLVFVFDLLQLLLILQWHFCRNFCNES